MLILNRKSGEAIVLGGVIRVVVLAVEQDRVKLGVDAPPDVVILRDEILDENSPHYRPTHARRAPDEPV